MTDTNDTDILTPIGEIVRMYIDRKTSKYGDPEKKPHHYEILLRFDTKDKEALAFRKKLESINRMLIGTKHVENSDQFTCRASSQFQPIVLDSNANELKGEDIPGFPGGSTGKAFMKVREFKTKTGSGINLLIVGIKELNLGEGGASVDVSDARALLLGS